MASQKSHTEVARLLLGKGADVNVRTTKTSTDSDITGFAVATLLNAFNHLVVLRTKLSKMEASEQ